MDKVNLLVNLPGGFYKTPSLRPAFARLKRFANVRRRSHNTPDEIARDLAWADVVLMWSWPALAHDALARAPRLKFSAQLDIGQAAARAALDRGFPVSVHRGAWSPAVAEMALTLILAMLRQTSHYHAAMRAGKETWVSSFPDTVDPLERELTGRPVGIVGFGQIGRRLAELLGPFHGKLRVYDPFVTEETITERGAKKTGLMEAIRQSDVVVLAASSNTGSAGLIGRSEIAAFRKNAVLVNVSRARLVDTRALVARLRRGDLLAAIDVFDIEPLPRTHPLRKLPNACLTPHRAGGLMASVHRLLDGLIGDIELFLAGKPRRYALTEQMIPGLDG